MPHNGVTVPIRLRRLRPGNRQHICFQRSPARRAGCALPVRSRRPKGSGFAYENSQFERSAITRSILPTERNGRKEEIRAPTNATDARRRIGLQAWSGAWRPAHADASLGPRPRAATVPVARFALRRWRRRQEGVAPPRRHTLLLGRTMFGSLFRRDCPRNNRPSSLLRLRSLSSSQHSTNAAHSAFRKSKIFNSIATVK